MRVAVVLVGLGCGGAGWEALPPADLADGVAYDCVVADTPELDLGAVPLEAGGVLTVPLTLRNTCSHAVDGTLTSELVAGRRAVVLRPSTLRIPAGASTEVEVVPTVVEPLGRTTVDVWFEEQDQPIVRVRLAAGLSRLRPLLTPSRLQLPRGCAMRLDTALDFRGEHALELTDLRLELPDGWTVSADPLPAVLGAGEDWTYEAVVEVPADHVLGRTRPVRLIGRVEPSGVDVSLLDMMVEPVPADSPARFDADWMIHVDGVNVIPLGMDVEDGYRANMGAGAILSSYLRPAERALYVTVRDGLAPGKVEVSGHVRCGASR